MFDLFFRKVRLRRELGSLRRVLETKKAEVAASETECRKAWGKKWSYIQMQRRKHAGNPDLNGEGGSNSEELDGQAGVYEMRRQQYLAELKVKEQELEALLAKERRLAEELGEEPVHPSGGMP